MAKATKVNEDKSPILNNPYEEPKLHYEADLNGNLNYDKILNGRRPYSSQVTVAPDKGKNHNNLFQFEDFTDADENATFINGIREEVKKWREANYKGGTRVTQDLLNFWFCNAERGNDKRLFFCQREAVETAVYLNEIADKDANMGRFYLNQLAERRKTISDNADDVLPRTAFKMATGTGKTVVMAMFIMYNYLNKKTYPQDTRFCDNFLLVAPGVTIRDRLSVLYLDSSVLTGKNEEHNDYYQKRALIPERYRKEFDGVNNAIKIVNYQQLERKDLKDKKVSSIKFIFKNGQMVPNEVKESFASVFTRIFGKNMKGKRVLIINDEAHHCYLTKIKEKKEKFADTTEKKEAEKNQEAARIWYEGLRQMKLYGINIQHVYDLSATPYYLKGSGHKEYSLFPWTVSDFGLVEAIESGLVKIPFLPKLDNTQDLSEPKLKNIYEHIKKELPKKGIKAQRKDDKENNKNTDDSIEIAPKLPTLLNTALDQFIKDYENYEAGLRGVGEMGKDLLTTPPVFIVVCNNTAVSCEVFKYLAGYKTKDANGNDIYIEGMYDVFSNYKDGLPKKWKNRPSLLIDSSIVGDASNIVDKEFKNEFADEIKNFKKEYAITNGAASSEKISDEEILREIVNTVGKQNKLGGKIRCVVSVSMLTEGWDANTVTHVCGVRAFGSQLLCEQVAGRALRRRNYTLRPYDKDGNEIPEENINRYKKENIIYKFPPEYAHIIGVPFTSFKQGKEGPTPPPTPSTLLKTEIKALPERKEKYEIIFPNFTGYRIVVYEQAVTANYKELPKYTLNFDEIPTETILATAVNEEQKLLKSDYMNIRDAHVIYVLTQWLISEKYSFVNREEGREGREFHKFAQLKKVVEYWYDNVLEIVGGNGDKEQRRLVIFTDRTNAANSIYEGILNEQVQDRTLKEHIAGVVNFYNPEGSTKYVHGFTAKHVYATKKSHVNYVVCDTATWEQIAAKTLEELSQVVRYVKNSFLGFTVPYIYEGEQHDYLPDFIAVVKTKTGVEVNLIIEISGFSNDKLGHKDFKKYYTENYWLPAVNNLGRYGKWDFLEITNIENIKSSLIHKINSL